MLSKDYSVFIYVSGSEGVQPSDGEDMESSEGEDV